MIWVRLNKVASKGEAANMMGVQWVGGPEHPSLQRPGPGSRKTNGAYEGFFARTFRFSVCIAQRHLSGCIFKCHMRVQTWFDPFLICMSALHLSLSLHTVCLIPAVTDKAHSAKILKLYLFTVCTWQLTTSYRTTQNLKISDLPLEKAGIPTC